MAQDAQHQTDQSSIMSFVTSPNTINLPTSVQPAKKKIKTSRKKSSWIQEYFVKGFTDKNEPAIICQIEKEDGIKCNVKLKHDGSTGNGIGHLWSIHKITKDGIQSVV